MNGNMPVGEVTITNLPVGPITTNDLLVNEFKVITVGPNVTISHPKVS